VPVKGIYIYIYYNGKGKDCPMHFTKSHERKEIISEKYLLRLTEIEQELLRIAEKPFMVLISKRLTSLSQILNGHYIFYTGYT
jgi:hypothetical protein